jgi:metal-dependent amidase/aminoacylase/carboxypeptidase family protein
MTAQASLQGASVVLRDLSKLLPNLEALYKDIHSHPELSMQVTRTAGIAADKLRKAGYEVTTGCRTCTHSCG